MFSINWNTGLKIAVWGVQFCPWHKTMHELYSLNPRHLCDQATRLAGSVGENQKALHPPTGLC